MGVSTRPGVGRSPSPPVRSSGSAGRDTSRVSRIVLLALVCALALLAPRAAAPSPRSPRSTDVVVRGYPYAARCPSAGRRDVVDRWGMDMCNCTSYVAWALAANGQRTDWVIRGAMDAWNWPHVARFGHVAYVTGVEADGAIDVAEYNLPPSEGGRSYLFDSRRDVRPKGAVFIY